MVSMQSTFPAPGGEVQANGEVQVIRTARGPVELSTFGEGPAVVALHGAMGGWDQSTLLARTIGEAGYRYVAITRPGYLGTPFTSGKSPEEQADLYAAVLDALGIDRAAMLTVSGGGPSAIHFALRHPGRCWGLVLVDTCGRKVDEKLPFAYHLLRFFARFPWLASRMMPKGKPAPEAAARRAITDEAIFARFRQDAIAWGLLAELNASTADRVPLRLAGTIHDVEVTRTREYPLERIAVPTLVVHGTKDPLVPFEKHGRVLATRIPGAELCALEGGEHAAIFSHRAQARAQVTDFLRRHAPRA